MPQPRELLKAQVPVAVGVVRRVAVVAGLVDLGLGELPVTVGVDGVEDLQRGQPERAAFEEVHAVAAAARWPA